MGRSSALNRSEALGLRKKTLWLSTLDGIAAAAMVGSSETFAIYFALKQSLDFHQVATITTLPLVLAAFGQAFIPGLVPFASLKRWLLVFVGVQIAGLVGLVLAISAAHRYEIILASLILYWVGGMVAQPLWLDWISGWMPRRSFAKFFARRNIYTTLVTLAVYATAGILLWQHPQLENFLYVFLFSLACRILSLGLLSLHSSPAVNIFKRSRSAAYPLVKLLQFKPLLFSLIFTVLFKFGVQFTAAYCNPYLLDKLNLDLLHFVAITSIPFVGRALFLAGWSEASRKLRPYIGLQIAMYVIALNPVLWMSTTSFGWLCSFEFISGMMWGGFELCAVLIVSEIWPGESRKLYGIHFAAMSLASLAGAYLGAKFFAWGWQYRELFYLGSDFRIAVALTYSLVMVGFRETRVSLQGYSDYIVYVLTLRPTYMLSRLLPMRQKLKRKAYAKST